MITANQAYRLRCIDRALSVCLRHPSYAVRASLVGRNEFDVAEARAALARLSLSDCGPAASSVISAWFAGGEAEVMDALLGALNL